MHDYRELAPDHQIYKHCPLCTAELFEDRDVVNLRLRPTCPDCGWIYYPPNTYGSLVVVEVDDGTNGGDTAIVLINPPSCPASAPAALPNGIAEYGETPEECAIREVQEETGLEIVLTGELGRTMLHQGFGPMLVFGFSARAAGGALREGDEGAVDVYPLSALPLVDPAREGSRLVLDAYLRRRR